jgi:hypothetical protein
MAFQLFTTCVGGTATSAQNGGDMRGWFHLISATRAGTNPPMCRAFSRKRLMGFEPTTFCMASRRSSQLSYSRTGADSSLGARFPALGSSRT